MLLPAPDQLTVDSVDTTSATVIWNQPPGFDQTHHHHQISYQCQGTEPHITTTSSTSILLSDLKPATKYSVTVCTVMDDGKKSQLVTTTLTTSLPAPDQLTVGLYITLSDLKPDTEYSVTVCTVLDNGKKSQLVTTTLTTSLPAPDQLTVDAVDATSATVIWNQPPGLDQTHHHYQISYQCQGTEPNITTTSSPSITLSDLKPATEYSVTVCTVLDNGKKSLMVLTTLNTMLPAPDQLTVDSVDTTSATVIWNQPPGLDQTHHHYQISYQCPGTEPHITTTSSPSITLSDLKPATEYSVTVCTVMDNRVQSNLVSTILTTEVPAPVDLNIEDVKCTSLTVKWTTGLGLNQITHHFLISYCSPGNKTKTVNTEYCYRTLSDLQPGTQYTIRVSTVLNNGLQSKPVSEDICTVLPAPDQLTVDSVDAKSATVIWNQPPGLDQTHHHYQISYQCPGTEPHISTTSSPSITLSDLKPATEYTVTVCTVMDNGKKSQVVTTTLNTSLPAPDQLTVDSVDTTSATVIWNQPPGLDQTHHQYQISYQCPETEPHITTTSSPSITLSDLKPATEYSVTVCTVKDNVQPGPTVSTTFMTEVPPPCDLTIEDLKSTLLTVRWTNDLGLDGTCQHSLISYCSPGKEPTLVITKYCSRTLSDLQPGTQYTISVSTVLNNGLQSKPVSEDICTGKRTEPIHCKKCHSGIFLVLLRKRQWLFLR
ncbi:hypothetical protein UPYG_G00355000 [Umbra pygmaea]|uniref:Fibronectin type-III domain-containing protein n=1 Tax=Umbra pygmaea TaxID=75934 RepID=A0ABD0VVN5_UMBPY